MKKICCSLALSLLSLGLTAQSINKYGLSVVSDNIVYQNSVRTNPDNKLVDLQKIIPGLALDIRYATSDNFVKQPVYRQARAFARLPVARALKKIQEELRPSGVGLKIYDAYRPYAVTVKFFEVASDKNFVANPKDGSRHNRGCAVDLTLIDLASGKELKMPTPYDSFSRAAAADYSDLPPDVVRNRDRLITLMQKHGFRVLNNEWWHFDFKGWRDYELMDIPFEQL